MMDTDLIYRAVCTYGSAKRHGWEYQSGEYLEIVKHLLNEADAERQELLATNERLVDEVNEARKETNEQARLNGMGAEREARLMAEVSELKAKLTDKASLLRGCYAADHKQKQRIEELTAERDALKAENALLAEVNAQLREQNDAVGEACAKYEAELERIKQSWDEWIKKTEWVQETCQPKELGRHRADVLRMRIEALQAELERIKALPPVAWRSSMGHGVTLKESITDDQKALTWDGKPMWQPLYALGNKI